MNQHPELNSIIDSVFESIGVDRKVADKAKKVVATTVMQELLYSLSMRLTKVQQTKLTSVNAADAHLAISALLSYYNIEEVKKEYRKIALLTVTDFFSHLKKTVA